MPRRRPPVAPITDPHVEACEALAEHFDPRLILPTSSGAWGYQNGIKVMIYYRQRECMTDRAWSVLACTDGVPRSVSVGAEARTASRAVAKALDAIVEHVGPGPFEPFEQQLQMMEHERRIAALEVR